MPPQNLSATAWKRSGPKTIFTTKGTREQARRDSSALAAKARSFYGDRGLARHVAPKLALAALVSRKKKRPDHH
jgi:hypothetical protein